MRAALGEHRAVGDEVVPRKPKPSARTKSGRLSRAYKGPARDAGTPELQAKREALVGQGADPALSATPLGCIFARGYFDAPNRDGLAKDRLERGLDFGRIHAALYQRWRDAVGPQPTEDRLAELQGRYNAMAGVLTEAEKSVLIDVCAFNVWPNWFFRRSHRQTTAARRQRTEYELLIDGLDALVELNASPKRKHRKPKCLTEMHEIA